MVYVVYYSTLKDAPTAKWLRGGFSGKLQQIWSQLIKVDEHKQCSKLKNPWIMPVAVLYLYIWFISKVPQLTDLLITT